MPDVVEFFQEGISELISEDLHALLDVLRNFDVEFRNHLTRLWVLDSVEQLAGDSEGGGDNSAGLSGMDSLRQNLDIEGSHDGSSKTSSVVEGIKGGSTGIKAVHNSDFSNSVLQLLNVLREMV